MGPATSTSSVTTVDDAMIRAPKTWCVDLTVAEARALLEDAHLHAVLLVEGARLRGVLVADDCTAYPGARPALARARLAGRTVVAGTPLAEAERRMGEAGLRRLAVVDGVGDLVGLLCRKRRGDGFCTEAGVEARRRERGDRARTSDARH